jgi:hypothetical protein
MSRLIRPILGLLVTLALSHGARAQVASVVNNPPTVIGAYFAILPGEVTDVGEAVPTVTVFHGETDAGTVAGNWEASTVLPGPVSATFNAPLVLVSPGTTYFFRARTTNSAGDSWAPTSETFQTPVTTPTVANLPATEIQALSATVGSSVLADGGEPPSVTIFYGTSDGGSNPASWAESAEVGVQFGIANLTLDGLTEGTQYFYRARANNSAGSDWAVTSARFTTVDLTPPVVANRVANNLTGNTAVLRGEVTDTGADDPAITIYHGPADGGTDPAGWDKSSELGPQEGKFSVFVSGLTEESVYFFRSFASNAAGTAWAPATENFTTTDNTRPPIVINEVHYDEDNKTVRSEFIELHNTTNETMNLSGWRISSAVNYRIPADTSVEPGGFLVIAENPNTVMAKWGVGALGPWTGKLDNDGEVIRLRNETDSVIDEVDYRLGFPWPTVGAAPSYSIELLNPGLENDLGGSWRASTGGSGNGESTLAAGDGAWMVFKGTAEPSAGGAWRAIGFDDGAWGGGDGAVGFGQGFVDTPLDDMEGNYSTIYLRKTFHVADPAAVGSLLLQALADDGFNAWINGTHIADFNVSGAELPFNAVAESGVNNANFVDYPIPNGGGLLVEGENVLAVQVLNSSLGGSDAYFDAVLLADATSSAGPTPGFPNSVFSTDVPPQVRHLAHTPQQPATGEVVTISALITDPDGVASASLEYQLVRPGGYIRLIDANYNRGWVTVAMNDEGIEGDANAGDNTWSGQVPATIQRHRSLVRYRLIIEDAQGNSVQLPYADDLQPNFAYYCYDGVPAWRGALRTGSPQVIYSSETLSKVPVYHMIASQTDVLGCMYTDSVGTARTYRYYATVVYDGVVYDHIKFRIKGQASTRVTGKNKIKWNFNRGHRFQARDNYGRKYAREWDKFALQTGTCPWWGSNASTAGMVLNEQGAYKMYRLLGMPSCNTHLFHLRIVDGPRETLNQYDGDFWGLYIALEEPDGRFLDEMGIPDGNLYKMNGGATKRNQGPTQATSNSDVNSFISQKNSASANRFTWWRRMVNLPRYYDYKIGTTLINNTDLRSEWNCLYYIRPVVAGDPNSRKWEMYPWDLDLTWESKFHIRSESVWENWQNVFRFSLAERDFENRAREVWDLMCSSGEGAKMVEEMKRFLDGDGVTRIVEANQALWDYHPEKRKKGIWYKNNPRLPAARQNWEGLIDYMKGFVSPGGYGANRLLNEKAATPSIVPAKPIITAIGEAAFPTNDLRFLSSAYAGRGSFVAMQWRLAEITDPDSPNFDPGEPWVYEITPVWESEEIRVFAGEITIPPIAARVGHTYRARVRHLGNQTQWSHWSDPVEFVASSPDVSFFAQNLMVTEVMYHPEDATPAELAAGYLTSDFEYIEVKNVGIVPLDLSDVRFTKGIDFDFVTGAITTLEGGGFVLVVRNQAAFELRYGAGLPIAGEYMPDNLSNAGENVKLSFGAGVAIQEFHYLDVAPWPSSPDGFGFSLVLLDPDSSPDHARPENWQASFAIGGSPGVDEAGTTLADWKSDNFTAAELADPLISGDLVDGDGDGLNTVLEYGLAGNPKVADAEQLLRVVRVIDAGQEFIALGFRRRVGASDLTYLIESSTNLIDWAPAAGVVLMESVDNGDGSVTETYRLPSALNTVGEVFLRLRVTVS